MTSGGGVQAATSHFEEAVRARFAVGSSRLPVMAFSVALFATADVMLSPSPPLALTIGLWCGYCLAYLAIAAAARVHSGFRLQGLMVAAIGVGALAGRGVECLLWNLDGLAWMDQALRFALHLAFVGGLILIPVAQSAAGARRMARLEDERTRVTSRLLMLQAQIEPHFLFNTLATLRSLIRRDAVVAGDLLDRMTMFLRAVLPDARQTSSTLSRELDIVESYLAIMQLRLGDRLAYSIEAAPETLAAHAPPLLLQPLVENAIKHGIEPADAGGFIAVRTAIDRGCLVVEVRNTGEALKGGAAAHTTAFDARHTGLHNLRDRLAVLHPTGAVLSLVTASDGATVAMLRMPMSPSRV